MYFYDLELTFNVYEWMRGGDLYLHIGDDFLQWGLAFFFYRAIAYVLSPSSLNCTRLFKTTHYILEFLLGDGNKLIMGYKY